MRFAIPVFLISSGTLLTLENLKIKTLKEFYWKKFQRVFIPYIIFSSFATYFYRQNIKNSFHYLVLALKDILTGQALVPYWFIPLLFELYLLFPLFWYFFTLKRIRPISILLISFIVSLVLYFADKELTAWYLVSRNFPLLGPFLFFFVLGMILKPLLLTENREWLKEIYFPFWAVLITIIYLGISMANPLENYYNARFVYGPTIFLLLFLFLSLFSSFPQEFF